VSVGLAEIETLAREQRAGEELIELAVRAARRQGATWRELGVVLGTTAEAARWRYAPGLVERRARSRELKRR